MLCRSESLTDDGGIWQVSESVWLTEASDKYLNAENENINRVRLCKITVLNKTAL
jgi:hypothetical protein